MTGVEERGRIESERARRGFFRMPPDAPPLTFPVRRRRDRLGPVGAALAALLGQRGLRVVALDRDDGAARAPPGGAPRRPRAPRRWRRRGRPRGGPAARRVRPGRPARPAAPPRAPRARRRRPASHRASSSTSRPSSARSAPRLADLPTVDVRLGHAVERRRADDGGEVTVEGTAPGGPFAVSRGARGWVRRGRERGPRGDRHRPGRARVRADVARGRRRARPRLGRSRPAAPDRRPRRPVDLRAVPGPRRRWEFRLKPGEDAEAVRQPAAVRARLVAGTWTRTRSRSSGRPSTRSTTSWRSGGGAAGACSRATRRTRCRRSSARAWAPACATSPRWRLGWRPSRREARTPARRLRGRAAPARRGDGRGRRSGWVVW